LYGQLTVNAGELLSDFMMAKNDAGQRFTDSLVSGVEVAALGWPVPTPTGRPLTLDGNRAHQKKLWRA
jgi:hypothetical protein